MSVVFILAAIALIVFVAALWPSADCRLAAVAGILLSVAMLLLGR